MGNLMEAFSLLRFLFLDNFSLCGAHKTKQQQQQTQLTRAPSIVQDCKDPSSGFLINKHELSYEEFHRDIDWSHLYFYLPACLNSVCTIINSRLMESCKPLRYWHLSADEYMSHWNKPRMDVGVVSGIWLGGLAWSMCYFRRTHTCSHRVLTGYPCCGESWSRKRQGREYGNGFCEDSVFRVHEKIWEHQV